MKKQSEQISPEIELRRNALDALIATNGETVSIGTKTVQAFLEEITSDEVIVAGGSAESGGFRVTVPFTKFPQKPVQLDEIKARGITLSLLSCIERNRVSYEITAGDPATE